jgi:hypothetical protein
MEIAIEPAKALELEGDIFNRQAVLAKVRKLSATINHGNMLLFTISLAKKTYIFLNFR